VIKKLYKGNSLELQYLSFLHSFGVIWGRRTTEL